MEEEFSGLDDRSLRSVCSFVLNHDSIIIIDNIARLESVYPMTETDITIQSGPLSLRGTLVAAGASPGPAALLVSGSGPLDRNSNAKRLPIDVMGQIASHLAAEGVTSLRYDKRGVGESNGEYLTAGIHDNIGDARAALEVLRARPEVDPRRIVVIGHSEGALIASDLARDGDLAGVALLAGAAHNGRAATSFVGRHSKWRRRFRNRSDG